MVIMFVNLQFHLYIFFVFFANLTTHLQDSSINIIIYIPSKNKPLQHEVIPINVYDDALLGSGCSRTMYGRLLEKAISGKPFHKSNQATEALRPSGD